VELARHFHPARPGEVNLEPYAVHKHDEVSERTDPPVRVQFQELRELRRFSGMLERYVRVSFASQERLTTAFEMQSWLARAKTAPDAVTTEYWSEGHDLLTSVDPIFALLEQLRLYDDDELSAWATDFDDALNASLLSLGAMADVVAETDAEPAADQLEGALLLMSRLAAQMLALCEREAEQVLGSMRRRLKDIFNRIDEEREMQERLGGRSRTHQPVPIEEHRKRREEGSGKELEAQPRATQHTEVSTDSQTKLERPRNRPSIGHFSYGGTQ
jgi:hypothetical protein